MQKMIFGLVVFLCLIVSFGVLAQTGERPKPPEGQTGIFFAPMVQNQTISYGYLMELRRKNQDYEFDISVSHNFTTPMEFQVDVAPVSQEGGRFQRGKLTPQAKVYTVQVADVQNPEKTLQRLALQIWNDENFYPALARFSRLPADYGLLERIIVPALPSQRYTIQEGDLLTEIAKKTYGDGRFATFIAEVNLIPKPYNLMPGQWLFLPKVKKEQYLAKDQETLSAIAEALYQTPQAASYLGLVNDLTSDAALQAGQKLFLPEIQGVYTVKAEDNVQDIASALYGDPWGAVILVKANELEVTFPLRVGQSLVLPVLKKEKYKVNAGETIGSIAIQLYQDQRGENLLAEVNNLANKSQLPAGTELFIPEIEPQTYSCAAWLEPEERLFKLEPGPGRYLKVKVKIPRNLSVGGTYSAMVGLQLVVPQEMSESGIYSAAVPVGTSLFILTIEGKEPGFRNAELNAVRVRNTQIEGTDYSVIGIEVKNVGRYLIRCGDASRMTLLEKSNRRALFPAQPLGEGMRIVLPQNSMDLETAYPVLPAGEYIVLAEVDVGIRQRLVREFAFTIGEGEVTAQSRAVSISVKTPQEEDVLIFDGLTTGRTGFGQKILTVRNEEWHQSIHCEVKVGETPGIDQKFAGNDQNGKPIFSVLKQFESFDLKPRESKNIRVTLRENKVQAGARYSRLVVSAKIIPNPQALPQEVLETERHIALFAISNTDWQYGLAGEHQGITIDKNGILKLAVSLTNTGNIHIKPEVELYIIDTVGQIVMQQSIPVAEYIYPSETREVQLQTSLISKEILEPKAYRLELKFTEQGKGLVTLKSDFSVPQDFRARIEKEPLVLPPGKRGEATPVDVSPSVNEKE